MSLIRSTMQSRGLKEAILARELGIDPSTVNRWLKGDGARFTGNAEQFVALGAVLDIDPILLLEYDTVSFPSVCDHVLRILGTRDWNRSIRALRLLERFVIPSTAWPPEDIASCYSAKTWRLFELSHDPKVKRDCYAPVVIHGRGSMCQVWHFAYRDKGLLGTSPWRHYGFVWWHRNRLELYTFHGFTMVAAESADGDSVIVETWFGRGAAEFRVASLHPFQAKLETERSSQTPWVRFCFAGETAE
jgi:transcriptional regulator with XRE-family HTH domain